MNDGMDEWQPLRKGIAKETVKAGLAVTTIFAMIILFCTASLLFIFRGLSRCGG
jgi:hypothetical protein